MSSLDCGNIEILDRVFKVYGFDDDAWYQGVKRIGAYGEFNHSNLAKLIGPNDVCLDLGANVGLMTLAMAMLAPKGHVYAFEGSPKTTHALEETIKANNLGNVTAKCAILGRDKDKVKFFDTPEMRAAGFCVSVDEARNVPRPGTTIAPGNFDVIVSETISVDSIISKLSPSRVDFIKIDVEGAELDVLDGARDTLSRFRPIVLMEFNSYTYTQLREIPPRRALKKILSIFDDVYYFKNRTSTSLVRIGDSEAEQEQFLHDNFCNGFVDDLVCCFHGANLNKRTVLTSSGNPEDNQGRMEFVQNTEKQQLQHALAQKQNELDAVYGSKSWRLTAILRYLSKNVLRGRMK